MKRKFSAAPLLLAMGICLSASAHDFETAEFTVAFEEFEELQFLKTGDPFEDWKSNRTWTSKDDKHLEGTIHDVREFSVAIRLVDGTGVNVPIFRFSEQDKRFIEEWNTVSKFFDLNHEPGQKTLPVGEADIDGESITGSKSFHETKHFRLESDVPIPADTLRHLCKVFEATHDAVQVNPIGLAIAQPADGKFRVRLFYHMEDYHVAGGRENSGGTYLAKEQTILVPLETTGLTDGKYQFSPHVLIHETTHALTHQWLNRAPIWFLEGFAEYMAMIPYDLNNGLLRPEKLEEGIRKEIAAVSREFREGFPLVAPTELVSLTFQGFMGEPELEDTPIEIPPLKQPVFQPLSKMDPPTDPPGPAAEEDATAFPAPDASGEKGEILTRQASHYVSALLLVHHLIDTDQQAGLRKFLFDVLTYRWEARKYLDRHMSCYEAYSTAINQQIADYNASLRLYQREMQTYVETSEGSKPVQPRTPVPLPVPEILRKPRTPEELSPFQFPGVAAKRHLDLPEVLSMEPFR
ncbi:MAG: hypothetical protein P1U87_12290 [Verrucomicrobiales bacterium]|nr:hypothetical protein [Verrucomicrobiales bacterium]